MLFSISWRNIWRNKVRSLVIIFSVALGIFAGVTSTAFMKGLAEQRIQKVIKSELSYIQVHKKGFRQNSELKSYIPGAAALTQDIRKIPHVTGASRRVVVQAMIASAETATGVLIAGVNPEQEKQVTNIHEKIIDGAYFEGIKKHPVVIGKKLAEKLNVKVRSKLVITLQDTANNVISGLFRIAGIYTTNNNMYDESHIFIRIGDLLELTTLPEDVAHEIAINIDDSENLPVVETQVKNLAGGLEVMDWKSLSPEMNYLTEAMELYMYIFMIIILLALLFGIINTMLMVVMERTKEIGMLMAIGMNKFRIFSMIVLESIMLSLTGGIVGIFIGALFSKWRSIVPIDLSMWAQGYEQLGFDAYVYLSLDPIMLVNVTILVIITGVIAALYPAYKALKNDPADALRME
ncbi:MAG: ABC transporter permease [Bacteroidetes bacterium]|nr:MAG: ABC transporter permease [Bacteroidota bacterium]RLD74040.1 MAG: ABC transporter permease [Bacteroidota bacterium]RLD88938.1 MAG: ABC transporter permease [Bacteroidota bacterium]